MQIIGLAKKVTIYIGESDRWGRKPLYAAILEVLKAEDCAGVTVTRALSGFGAHSRIHTASLVALSTDLPLVIEWVDSPARVRRVMPRLREMVREGLITVQDVEVVAYSHRRLRDLPADTPVRDVMHREVHTVAPDTPLAEAVTLLLDKRYRALPVVEAEGKVVGILTDGDLLHRAGLLATSVQALLTEAELRAHLAHLRRQNVTVAEVMTAPAVTVGGQTPLGDALRRMVEADIKRLPVVDDAGRLLGILSRVDVLRALARPPVEAVPRPAPPDKPQRTVGEMMMTTVPTVLAGAPLAEVVNLLVGSAQRRVVVVDDTGRVVGIITDGDLLRRATETERGGILRALTERIAPGKQAAVHLQTRSAREVMTPQPVCVRPHTPLPDALRLLLEHRIKRLPVVDAEGRLVGMVGRGGILQSLYHSD